MKIVKVCFHTATASIKKNVLIMIDQQPYRAKELNPFKGWLMLDNTIEEEETLIMAKSVSKQLH